MFDKIITKLIKENLSPIQGFSEKRVNDLIYIKSKIRENPEEVEAWFDNEIDKIKNIDINSSLNDILKGRQTNL